MKKWFRYFNSDYHCDSAPAINPFSNQTITCYFVPENLISVFVVFHDEFGREVNKVKVTEKGFGKIEANTENLASGMYSYSIVVDGKAMDTKKMLRSK